MAKFGAGFGKDTMLLDSRPCRTFTSCQNQVPLLHPPPASTSLQGHLEKERWERHPPWGVAAFPLAYIHTRRPRSPAPASRGGVREHALKRGP